MPACGAEAPDGLGALAGLSAAPWLAAHSVSDVLLYKLAQCPPREKQPFPPGAKPSVDDDDGPRRYAGKKLDAGAGPGVLWGQPGAVSVFGGRLGEVPDLIEDEQAAPTECLALPPPAEAPDADPPGESGSSSASSHSDDENSPIAQHRNDVAPVAVAAKPAPSPTRSPLRATWSHSCSKLDDADWQRVVSHKKPPRHAKRGGTAKAAKPRGAAKARGAPRRHPKAKANPTATPQATPTAHSKATRASVASAASSNPGTASPSPASVSRALGAAPASPALSAVAVTPPIGPVGLPSSGAPSPVGLTLFGGGSPLGQLATDVLSLGPPAAAGVGAAAATVAATVTGAVSAPPPHSGTESMPTSPLPSAVAWTPSLFGFDPTCV